MRRAQNRKPATYRCPFCDRYLPALSEHVLVMPEGDPSRRRHAHTDCVLAERKSGRLPTREEWRSAHLGPPREPRGPLERLKRLFRRTAS